MIHRISGRVKVEKYMQSALNTLEMAPTMTGGMGTLPVGSINESPSGDQGWGLLFKDKGKIGHFPGPLFCPREGLNNLCFQNVMFA